MQAVSASLRDSQKGKKTFLWDCHGTGQEKMRLFWIMMASVRTKKRGESDVVTLTSNTGASRLEALSGKGVGVWAVVVPAAVAGENHTQPAPNIPFDQVPQTDLISESKTGGKLLLHLQVNLGDHKRCSWCFVSRMCLLGGRMLSTRLCIRVVSSNSWCENFR